MTEEEAIRSIVDDLNDHLMHSPKAWGEMGPVQSVTCGDGTEMSVQASQYHYCTPRSDEGPWASVEVKVDSEMQFFEIDDDGIGAYVAIEDVAREIYARRGDMKRDYAIKRIANDQQA